MPLRLAAHRTTAKSRWTGSTWSVPASRSGMAAPTSARASGVPSSRVAPPLTSRSASDERSSGRRTSGPVWRCGGRLPTSMPRSAARPLLGRLWLQEGLLRSHLRPPEHRQPRERRPRPRPRWSFSMPPPRPASPCRVPWPPRRRQVVWPLVHRRHRRRGRSGSATRHSPRPRHSPGRGHPRCHPRRQHPRRHRQLALRRRRLRRRVRLRQRVLRLVARSSSSRRRSPRRQPMTCARRLATHPNSTATSPRTA
jgi:hypothetical protein